jgi:MoaE-MoaD fusion protein
MRVLFFAHLKGVVGRGEIDLPCDNVDADSLWERLTEVHPSLAKFRNVVRLAKNAEFVTAEARFHDTDEVALIPPVSGG